MVRVKLVNFFPPLAQEIKQVNLGVPIEDMNKYSAFTPTTLF